MRFTTILVFLGLIGGCADSNPVRPTPDPPQTSPTPSPFYLVSPSISSISPTSAMAGSSDLTLKVIGTNFESQGAIGSWVIWSASGTETDLRTRLVSTTELTAVVPAALLSQAGTARVFVINGDIMGFTDGVRYPESNAVDFNVIPANAVNGGHP